MSARNTPTGRGFGTVLAALLLLSAGACDFLAGVSEPEQVRVEISSDDVTSATLVTALHFIQVPNPECAGDPGCGRVLRTVNPDTTVISLPYDRTFQFSDRLQFFAETYPPDGAGATMSMRVRIDGKDWFNDFRTLAPHEGAGERETLEFAYQFKELGIEDIIN